MTVSQSLRAGVMKVVRRLGPTPMPVVFGQGAGPGRARHLRIWGVDGPDGAAQGAVLALTLTDGRTESGGWSVLSRSELPVALLPSVFAEWMVQPPSSREWGVDEQALEQALRTLMELSATLPGAALGEEPVKAKGSGRYKRERSSLDSFESAVNTYERALCLPTSPESLRRVSRAAQDAHILQWRMTDAQVADARFPGLLARMRHGDHLKMIQGNPAELLRERMREAEKLLREMPGELSDRVLAILKPGEP